MDFLNWIIIIAFILGITGLGMHVYNTAEDIENKEQVCQNNLGEYTSGMNHGCLINSILYDMTKTKNGWIVLNQDINCVEDVA